MCTNINKNKAEKYIRNTIDILKDDDFPYDCLLRRPYETACACVKTATVWLYFIIIII